MENRPKTRYESSPDKDNLHKNKVSEIKTLKNF